MNWTFAGPDPLNVSDVSAVCGDTVIWKPSSDVPLTAIAVQHVANRVMADHGLKGIFNLLVGSGATVGERLLGDSRIPLISFTGSTNMGHRVAEACAALASQHSRYVQGRG